MDADTARSLRRLLDTRPVGTLGTLHRGEPAVSMVPYVLPAADRPSASRVPAALGLQQPAGGLVLPHAPGLRLPAKIASRNPRRCRALKARAIAWRIRRRGPSRSALVQARWA
jgi:heme iron utilization protein